MKKIWKRTGCVCLVLLLLLGISCGIYLSDYYKADENALQAMTKQNDGIEVQEDNKGIYFTPENTETGLIFYPGGKVQCEAYAPLMRACAQKGIFCALLKMPGNLAVLKPNAADGIQEKYPQIKNWYIGGHSLGGAMSASYVAKHAEKYKGLILLAAYATSDLHETNLRVLSIYGSEDGVLNRESYEKNKSNLPKNSTEKILDGGCHAYFGSYGAQKGDGNPSITSQKQVEETVECIVRFLKIKIDKIY